jgi:hypothetical protein
VRRREWKEWQREERIIECVEGREREKIDRKGERKKQEDKEYYLS